MAQLSHLTLKPTSSSPIHVLRASKQSFNALLFNVSRQPKIIRPLRWNFKSKDGDQNKQTAKTKPKKYPKQLRETETILKTVKV